MYVYVISEEFVWTVGFFMPDNSWYAESDHFDPDSAAKRTAWLNGAHANGMIPEGHEPSASQQNFPLVKNVKLGVEPRKRPPKNAEP